MLGSASIDLAQVSSGRLGLFLQANLHPWDWYPGAALVIGAGGVAVEFDRRGNRWHIAGNRQSVEDAKAALTACPSAIQATTIRAAVLDDRATDTPFVRSRVRKAAGSERNRQRAERAIKHRSVAEIRCDHDCAPLSWTIERTDSLSSVRE